jgi:hypothetical protein
MTNTTVTNLPMSRSFMLPTLRMKRSRRVVTEPARELFRTDCVNSSAGFRMPVGNHTFRSRNSDGRVAVTYLLTATLQTQMGPIPASGQKILLRGVHVLHQQGGLICCSEDYWDADVPAPT